MTTTMVGQSVKRGPKETWISQTEAMSQFGISYNKLMRHVWNDGLRRKRSGRDKKIMLVCVEQLEKLLQDKPVELY